MQISQKKDIKDVDSQQKDQDLFDCSIAQDMAGSQSNCLRQYRQFFNLQESIGQQPLFKNTSQVQYQQNGEYEQIHTFIIKKTENYQIVSFQIKYGLFSVNLKILNVQGKSSTHQLQHISSTFATIFITSSQMGQFAIKCFGFNQQTAEVVMFTVLKQYSILKIADSLNIGPSLNKLFGFDLIVYEDCVEFAMQKCQNNITLNSQLVNGLKQKLRKMHSLNIIHMDIKPDNICYSKGKNQLIFIDFGLSKIIKEAIGFKTFTYFSGSLGYCSSEMVQRYNQEQGFVDLYFNDIHCLTQSFQEISSSNKQAKFRKLEYGDAPNSSPSYINSKRAFESYLRFRLKFILFDQRSELKTVYESGQITNYNELVVFIAMLPYSAFLQHWYYIFLKQVSKNQRQVKSYFNFTLKNQSGFIKLISSRNYQRQINFEIRAKLFQIKLKNECFFNKVQLKNIEKHNLKMLLTNSNLRQKMSMQTYICQYLLFIDFRTSLSTFDQKLSISQIMIDHFHLSNTFTSQFSVIQTCLIFIKTYLLSKQCKNIQHFLPLLYCNLLILQTLQVQQIIQLTLQIIKLTMHPLSQAKLLMRCSFAISWFNNCSISRYSKYKLHSKIMQIIIFFIVKLADEWKEKSQLIPLIADLLKGNMNIIPLQEITQKFGKILQISQINIKYEFQIELLIFYFSIRIKKEQSLLQDQCALYTMRLINTLQNKVWSNQIKFQYYHFNMIHLLINTSNHKSIVNLFQRLKVCLQHPKLVERYKIYFYCKRLEFNRQNSVEIYCNFLLKLIKQNNLLENSQILHNINEIICQQKFKNNKQIGSLVDILRQKCSFKQLMSVKFPENSYMNSILSFYDNWNRILFIYYYLFNQTQTPTQLSQQFQQLITKLQNYWENIICKDCKNKSLVELVLFKGSAFQFVGLQQRAINLYMSYLSSQLTLDADPNRKLSIAIYILQISLQNQELARIKNSFVFVYEYIKSQNQLGIKIPLFF